MKKLVKRILYKIIFRNNKLGQNINISLNASLSNSTLNDFSRVASGADVRNSDIGNYSSVGRDCKMTHTSVGKFCAISWNTSINAISHPYNHLTINAFPYVPYVGNFVTKRIQTVSTVKIGNDVWIGAHSIIMPGINIGDGAVIGAGSVVTKDVAPYSIVVGVPAREIRKRFPEETIKSLLSIKWWDLPKEVIKKHIELFQRPVDTDVIKKLESIEIS